MDKYSKRKVYFAVDEGKKTKKKVLENKTLGRQYEGVCQLGTRRENEAEM